MTSEFRDLEALLHQGYTVTAMRAGGYHCRSAEPLTARETTCIRHIEALTDELKVTPTVREIAVSMGLKSKSSVHRLIQRLELKGRLARIPHRKRGLVLLADGPPAAGVAKEPERRSVPTIQDTVSNASAESKVGTRGRLPLGLGWFS